MSKKNYDAMKYIRAQLSDFDPRFINGVNIAFNRMCNIKDPQGCLSTSAQLLLIAKYYGYDAQLVYGLCVKGEQEFYHAWLEIDHKIIDVAIYGNSNYSKHSQYMGSKLRLPIINETYDNNLVSYGRFTFDDDWLQAQISIMENQTIEAYFDMVPFPAKRDILWVWTCELMGELPTSELIDELRSIARTITIEAP